MGSSTGVPVNMLTLQILPAGSERYFDGSRPVTIGRDTAADVVVLDASTSRQHAVLRLEGARWVFEDRESSNGSFLDGERIGRLSVDRAMILSLGSQDGGCRIRLVPPTPGGALDPHTPTVPVFAGASTAPGTFTGTYRTSSRVRIGRALDNDIVVDDLLASRHHAELRTAHDGAFELVDLGSHNGTYVDGRRVNGRQRLREGALVAVGHTLLRLQHGTLEEYVDAGEASFAALGLTVNAGRRVLLDEVSFALEGGQFLAVLGPTGAGKSTLLKALTGSRPADRGSVLYNGRDVYGSYAELRNRIGYVPQDDILHPELTVKAALDYAARLRFPPDVPAAERAARVAEVMTELGLEHRADVRVASLSGGQRKRTSVAIELLTRPSLLILDEPTSGLDPGYEKSVMQLLRDLGDGGRTVLTVTHSIQSLDMCDRILFLAPGGQTAYFGPPARTLGYFGQPGYPEVFQQLDRETAGAAKQAFADSEINREYVAEPLAAQRDRMQLAAAHPEAPRRNPHSWRQLGTLMRRYLALISADKRNTLLLFAQAPVLGLLMLAAFGKDNLVPGTAGAASNSTTVLLALTLAASYLGAANSIREIVKERPILTRERSVGQSAAAYILSKALILGVITVVESFVLTFLALLRQGGPAHGALLLDGKLEVAIGVSLAGLSAMALGLMVSALSGNADKVMTILPVILFAQFVLSGSAFPVRGTAGLDQISYLSSARWGYSAAAATVDLDKLLQDGCNGQHAPSGAVMASQCDPAHAPTKRAWTEDVALLGALTVLELIGAGIAIRPIGRPRRS
ncbi:ATP-binding cassette domain-containing protein [Actinospica robiniae]|uniref:ATP-binding cassette domain-containing protein n=1 Tax=Actinospica robiniae TaxID=304901 RepID=UPI000A043296|nr:ATP-binding cassette domain-containing protein [Actinospica robiniae]